MLFSHTINVFLNSSYSTDFLLFLMSLLQMHHSHSHHLSRHLLRYLLHPRHHGVVLWLHWCRPSTIPLCHPHTMVWNLSSSGVSRCLFWLQRRADYLPCSNGKYSPSNPYPTMVSPNCCDLCRRRHFTVRRMFCGIILCDVLYLDGPVLLCIWISTTSISHSRRHMC